MANTPRGVSLRDLRKKAKKVRVTASLGTNSYDALVSLMEKEPNATISQIIGDSIVFAHINNMYAQRMLIPPIYEVSAGKASQQTKMPQPSTVRSTQITPNKEQWCADCGGYVDGTMCRFNKYEVTATGTVVRNEISMPIRTMSDNEADFRKSILGGFATVSEAEVAFENQAADEIFDESEIPGR